jgi:hypothetical protein
MKVYWGSGCTAPRILDLSTRWRWVVSFTPRPLYPHGKSPRYPLDRGFVGSEPVWMRWWKEKFPAAAGTRTPDHPAQCYIIELSRLLLRHWNLPYCSLPMFSKPRVQIRTTAGVQPLTVHSFNALPSCLVLWGSAYCFSYHIKTLCIAFHIYFVPVRDSEGK